MGAVEFSPLLVYRCIVHWQVSDLLREGRVVGQHREGRYSAVRATDRAGHRYVLDGQLGLFAVGWKRKLEETFYNLYCIKIYNNYIYIVECDYIMYQLYEPLLSIGVVSDRWMKVRNRAPECELIYFSKKQCLFQQVYVCMNSHPAKHHRGFLLPFCYCRRYCPNLRHTEWHIQSLEDGSSPDESGLWKFQHWNFLNMNCTSANPN